MALADDIEQVSVLRSRLQQRRYDGSTLRVLELVVSCSSVDLRRSLISLVRSHSLSSLPHSHDFFLAAFSLLQDIQSWLSLRYESLLLRQRHPHPQLGVSSSEWFSFAQLAFAHAFYSIAAQACHHALLCFNLNAHHSSSSSSSQTFSIQSIHRLHYDAIRLSSNHSVQAHAAEYSKKKNLSQKQSSIPKEKGRLASVSFKKGIKLHNARNLMRLKNQ